MSRARQGFLEVAQEVVIVSGFCFLHKPLHEYCRKQDLLAYILLKISCVIEPSQWLVASAGLSLGCEVKLLHQLVIN